jgi:hypothetical protein
MLPQLNSVNDNFVPAEHSFFQLKVLFILLVENANE